MNHLDDYVDKRVTVNTVTGGHITGVMTKASISGQYVVLEDVRWNWNDGHTVTARIAVQHIVAIFEAKEGSR